MKKLVKYVMLSENVMLYNSEKTNNQGHCGSKTNQSPCGSKSNSAPAQSCGGKSNRARFGC